MLRVRDALLLTAAACILLGQVACAVGGPDVAPTPTIVEIRLGSTGFVGLPVPLVTLGASGPSAFDVTRALDDAREDADVVGVVLRMAGSAFSRADSQEIATELERMRDAGKRVVFFDESFSNRDYVLAAQGDDILTVPTGTVDVLGMAFDVLFYAGLLRKIGVEVDYVREGSYKSAIEPYTRTEMSPELERTMKRLLDDLYEQMVARIAAGRDMGPAHVRELIDGGPYLAREAAENGLVDALLYEDELEAWLDESIGVDVTFERAIEPDDASELGGIRRIVRLWQRSFRTQTRDGSPREKIALVRVDGMIVTGSPEDPYRQGDFITAGAVAHALASAAADETVKAIVLRVNSPGGSALASDVIWRAVHQARLEKPVIASMAGVAASGGYYVAMAADHVLAEEGTLTGSIGVFGAKFNLGGLYDKVGIRKQILTRGRNATLYDEAHGFTPSERDRVSALIRQIYEDFVSKAADARNMSVDALDALAQGQVWTGREALAHGLIDEVGGLKRAFAVAKDRAGYPEDTMFELLELPEVPSLLDLLLRDGFAALRANPHLAATTEWQWAMPLVALSRERAFAMLPYALRIR